MKKETKLNGSSSTKKWQWICTATFAVLVVSLMLVSAASAAAAATYTFSGGTGTADDPYQIKTAQDFKNLTNYLATGHRSDHFSIENDIDCTGVSGIYKHNEKYFSGSIEGNGFTVSNITDSISAKEHSLFGRACGVISNLSVSNVTIFATNEEDEDALNSMRFGTLATKLGRNGGVGKIYSATIYNCSVSNVTFNLKDTNGDYLVGAIAGLAVEVLYKTTIEKSSVSNFTLNVELGDGVTENHLESFAGIVSGIARGHATATLTVKDSTVEDIKLNAPNSKFKVIGGIVVISYGAGELSGNTVKNFETNVKQVTEASGNFIAEPLNDELIISEDNLAEGVNIPYSLAYIQVDTTDIVRTDDEDYVMVNDHSQVDAEPSLVIPLYLDILSELSYTPEGYRISVAIDKTIYLKEIGYDFKVDVDTTKGMLNDGKTYYFTLSKPESLVDETTLLNLVINNTTLTSPLDAGSASHTLIISIEGTYTKRVDEALTFAYTHDMTVVNIGDWLISGPTTNQYNKTADGTAVPNPWNFTNKITHEYIVHAVSLESGVDWPTVIRNANPQNYTNVAYAAEQVAVYESSSLDGEWAPVTGTVVSNESGKIKVETNDDVTKYLKLVYTGNEVGNVIGGTYTVGFEDLTALIHEFMGDFSASHVSKGKLLYGDIDSDGYINGNDMMYLFQYTGGYETNNIEEMTLSNS